MVKRSKIEDVYNDLSKVETKAKEKKDSKAFTRVNFYIAESQKEKLEHYAEAVSPKHIKVTQSEVIRYMIENFDLDKAKKDFFKV